MKPIQSNVTKSIPLGCNLLCIDNSGAKVIQLIAVKGYKGRRRKYPRAGVSDVIIASVKKGNEKMRHKVVYAVIVRQKKEYRRPDGTHIRFTDNAAVIVKPKTFDPQGSEIRSVIAREVIERFTSIGKIASMVV